MKTTSQHGLRLTHPAAGPVSRARKQFNTLIKKLEAARTLVAAWKETLPTIASRADSEYKPLAERHDERLKQLVVLLDELHGNALLGKRERDKLSKFVASTALDLLSWADDETLKGIYNRHGGADFDAEEAASKDELRAVMEALLGTEFKGDIDLRSPEAMREAFEAQLGEQYGDAAPAAHQEVHRPKRAADLAREQRQAAEAQRLQHSMRDIFRKLASQLHPDRETDEAERLRKTALMQRVNVAYAANDMLGLLELQLEVEQIDQASLASLGDDRIKQYNKVLSEQLAELGIEIGSLVEAASMMMRADIFDEVTPEAMRNKLERDIADLQHKIALLDEDLLTLRDVKKLKAWLKSLPKATSKQSPRFDDDLFW